jgi:hypothetical protein
MLGPNVEWGIYRSHPPSPERALAIRRWMAAANIPVRRSEVTTSFAAMVRPGDNATAELWFGSTRIHAFAGDAAVERAEAAVPRLNALYDAVPAMFEIVARGSKLVGKGVELFAVDEVDSVKSGNAVETMVANALRALKRAAFSLSQRAGYGGQD